MKLLKTAICMMLFVMLLLLVGCNNATEADKTFSIYLVKDLSTTEAMEKNLDELPLESKPIITDREIRTYN